MQNREPPDSDDRTAPPEGGAAGPAIDPVCGMRVDPASAAASRQHAGRTYHFCCAGCAERFSAAPSEFLNAPARQRAPTGDLEPAAHGYVCPMHPEVLSATPGPCPRCGMAL
jgi:P-type Cu+ transporter